MAKEKAAAQADDLNDLVDDNKASETETPVTASGRTKEEIEADILKAQEMLKNLRREKKGEKPKKEKELKGTPVTFKNKAEETITGLGVLYYVVRAGGKLHYKEASQVRQLTPEEVTAWEAEQKAAAAAKA